ncbi:MAG: hypothetical protein NTW14_07285 [bacterium]|nr:hypothetical protein [bacterium]
MPLNPTENYLRERRDRMMINFQETVTTANTYLKGPGGYAGDGYPMPAPGKILRLYTWDGLNIRSSITPISFNAGDRISVYATYDVPYMLITVRINGVASGSYCNLVLANTTILASALLRLDVY